MKVFVFSDKNGIPIDYDDFSAMFGFREMGHEICFFHSYEELKMAHDRDSVIIGGVGLVKQRLRELGIELPNIDYPDELNGFLGRKIWTSFLNCVSSSPEMFPVFIKPVHNKIFQGRIINSLKDLIGCGNCYGDTEIYCSETVNFLSEYRCFVRYGKILDLRQYKGDWHIYPNSDIIEKCVAEYKDAPKGYALDFGVTDDGRTLLIEVNATVSIGSYGLEPISYAKLISARWAELTGIQDECAFDIININI